MFTLYWWGLVLSQVLIKELECISSLFSLFIMVLLLQMRSQSGVDLSVLGSWSIPKEGQEHMESFLRDLSTIFPQDCWLQLSRTIGKMGFNCHVIYQDLSESLNCDYTDL